jgi:hypothetical protein
MSGFTIYIVSYEVKTDGVFISSNNFSFESYLS